MQRFAPPSRPVLGAVTCRNLKKDLENVNMDLFLNMQRWLKAHGKTSRPKLSDEQKAQLKTCFELMDADGSGAIDADELQDAFELLGLKLSRSEIQELLDEVDRDGSGECEYPEFVEIMTLSLNKIREEQEKTGETQGPDISFELMATAYRRKRLMEGLMSGDREVQNQIINMANQQLSSQDALDKTKGKAAASAADDTPGAGEAWPSTHSLSRFMQQPHVRDCLRQTPVLPALDLEELAKLARGSTGASRALRRIAPDEAALQGVLLLLRAPLESPSRAYLQRAARRLRALVSVGLVTPQPDIATDARQLTPRNPAVGEAPVTLHQTSASELLAALTGPQADSMEGESPLMRPDGRAPRVRMRAPCSLPSLQRKPARRRVGAASGPAVGAAAASRRGLLSGDDRCCRTTPDIDAVFAET